MVRLLDLLRHDVNDTETHDAVAEIVGDRGRWRDAHGMFSHVRGLLLDVDEGKPHMPAAEQRRDLDRHHYAFLEACLQTV